MQKWVESEQILQYNARSRMKTTQTPGESERIQQHNGKRCVKMTQT
jgi:hypothetical protein